MELTSRGEQLFKKCKPCHAVGADAVNKSGPVLTGLVGRTVGSVAGFKYSSAMNEANEAGLVWTPEELAAFLTSPKAYLKGTKMVFVGFRAESDALAVIAYLKTFGN